MKNTIFIIMAFMFMPFSQAQEIVEKTTNISPNSNVFLNFDFADQIIIKSWNKNEALVKATVNINDNSDNDKFSLEIEANNNETSFTSDVKDLEELSKHNSTYLKGVIVREDDNCIHMEIDFEVFLPVGVAMNINTISGNIEIIGHTESMHIKTISGFIDLSVHPKSNLNFELETITGGFYSNLDLDLIKESDWKHHFVGGDVEATLNGGGNDIKLETISGDIYLRKEKE